MEYKIPIFVINLDSAKDRLQKFKVPFDKHNIPFFRWSATPGSALDSSKFGKKPLMEGVYITGFREWSKNEAACGVSHIQLLQHIVKNNLPWAIILEDDGILKRNITLFLKEWDIPINAELVLINNRAEFDEVANIGNTFSYGKLVGGAGTDGYLVSKIGAKKLLKILYPLKDPLDFQLFSHCKWVQENDSSPYFWRLPQNPNAKDILLDAYCLTKPIIDHSGDDSDIGGQRHPRARYYCKVLLGIEFQDDTKQYVSALLKRPEMQSELNTSVFKDWKGVDISHYDGEQDYRLAENEIPMSGLKILKLNGVDLVRISLWTNAESPMNLERALKLASKANKLGFDIYLVLHYSDFWADPTHQKKPRKWAGLDFDSLCDTLCDYTSFVIKQMYEIGVEPKIIQIGNEVTNGMLWADENDDMTNGGKLYDANTADEFSFNENQWEKFTTLLKCATNGVKEARLYRNYPLTMIQIDKGATPGVAAWWFDKIVGYKVDFDIIGLSFYYLWHEGANTKQLIKLKSLCAAFPDKMIMIAETSYPHELTKDMVKSPNQDEPNFSLQGQKKYLRDMRKVLADMPNTVGLCWWGAFFINDAIESCEELFRAQALFSRDKVQVPALSEFKTKLR